MSISTIVTRGFGLFGSIPKIILRGYGTSAPKFGTVFARVFCTDSLLNSVAISDSRKHTVTIYDD